MRQRSYHRLHSRAAIGTQKGAMVTVNADQARAAKDGGMRIEIGAATFGQIQGRNSGNCAPATPELSPPLPTAFLPLLLAWLSLPSTLLRTAEIAHDTPPHASVCLLFSPNNFISKRKDEQAHPPVHLPLVGRRRRRNARPRFWCLQESFRCNGAFGEDCARDWLPSYWCVLKACATHTVWRRPRLTSL